MIRALAMSKMKVRNELVIKIFQKTEKPVVFSSHFSLRYCVSKTRSMIWFSFHSLQGKFVEIYVLGIVSVEVQNYLLTNFAAFLAMLAALASNMEK